MVWALENSTEVTEKNYHTFRQSHSPRYLPEFKFTNFERHISKDICTFPLTAASFTVVKTWKQPKCLSTDEWIKKCRDMQWDATKP